MEAADWAVSSVVFVVAIGVSLAVAATLISDDPTKVSESQLKEILESISEEIQIRSMILKSDCDASTYDCNREYPVEIDIRQARHNFLSTAFTKDENKLYSIMPLGAITKLYSFPQQKLTPSYSTAAYTLASDVNVVPAEDINNITITNQHLTATITDWNSIIDFTDSAEQDLVVAYPEMHLARLKATETSVIVGNDGNRFYMRFFPNSAEFWIDTPDDINVTITPVHQNWKFDENIGVFNRDAWWDPDATDAYIWHYRIPLVVHSQDTARNNLDVKVDINFALQKERLGLALALEPDSFRLLEYRDTLAFDSTTSTYSDSTALENQPFNVAYNSSTQTAAVKWTVLGSTPANSHRVFYLYFDFTNYPKTSYNYSTIDYTAPDPPVFITVAFPQGRGETKVFDANSVSIFNPNTILLNTVNQLSRVWQVLNIGYRKPLRFDAGNYDRNAMYVSADINFAYEFESLGLAGSDLNTDSLSLYQVNNWAEGTVTETFTLSDQNLSGRFDWTYNSTTKVLTLSWSVPPTPAKGRRHYFIYFGKAEVSASLPVTTDDSNASWHTSDQTVTLSPTDNSGTGISATYYCTDSSGGCTPSTVYTAAIQVACSANPSCQQYVRYYSVDNADNAESIKTSNLIRIDKAVPVTSDNAPSGVQTSDVTIALTPTDTGSGISATYYCVDTDSTCAPSTLGTSIIVGCPAGQHCYKYVRYYSVDSAGNTETVNTTSTIDIDKPAGWALSDWNYRKKLTFNNSAQAENLYNFPAMVKLTSTNFDYNKVKSSGGDIRFTDSDGTTLNFELEWWSPSGDSYFWVRVPQIDASSSTDYIYMYYGNPNASGGQNAPATWHPSYKMVLHLNDAGTTRGDSTPNNNNGTAYGVTKYDYGRIGRADYFDGLGDYISVPDSSTLDLPNQLTIEAWVMASTSGTIRNIVEKGKWGAYPGTYMLRIYHTNMARFGLWQDSGDSGSFIDGTASVSNYEWYHVAGTWNGSTMKLFVNGSYQGSYPYTKTLTPNPYPLRIGAREGNQYPFNGKIDEVRVSDIARSEYYLHATYLSEKNSYITFGAEEIP